VKFYSSFYFTLYQIYYNFQSLMGLSLMNWQIF
jgi:hypothetical protein